MAQKPNFEPKYLLELNGLYAVVYYV